MKNIKYYIICKKKLRVQLCHIQYIKIYSKNKENIFKYGYISHAKSELLLVFSINITQV